MPKKENGHHGRITNPPIEAIAANRGMKEPVEKTGSPDSTGVRIPSALQSCHIIWILGIAFILGIGILIDMYEKQVVQTKNNSTITKYEEQIDNMSKQYEEQIDNMRKQKIQYKEQIDNMRKQKVQYEEQIDNMRKQKIGYEKQIDTMRKQKIEYEGQITMYESQLVKSYHVYLINSLKLGMCKTDMYFADIIKYCELKAMDESWSQLNREQIHQMYQLRDDLGLDGAPDIDTANAVVKKFATQTSNALSPLVEMLMDALHELDIENMKQIQDNIDIKSLYTFIEQQKKLVKMEIMKAAHEYENRGQLKKFASAVYDIVIPKGVEIIISMTARVLKTMIVL